MSRTAQLRISEGMDADLEVVRPVAASLGMGSTLTEVLRLSIRQLRLRIDAGLPLIDPETAQAAARAAPPPVDHRQVDRPRWTPADEKLLGKAPDEDVATKLGRSTEAVQVRRRALKIPKYKPPAAKPRKPRK